MRAFLRIRDLLALQKNRQKTSGMIQDLRERSVDVGA